MRINDQYSAQNAHRNYRTNQVQTSKSNEKMSSGLRINKAGDDAAGLAISQNLLAHLGGLNAASRNVQDGFSLIQTADAALSESHSILGRMSELALQAGSDLNGPVERNALNEEFQQLKSELDNIAGTTTFNSQGVLDGSYQSNPLTLQTGANQGDTMAVQIGKMDAYSLGISDTSLLSGEGARGAVDLIKTAINTVSSQRADLGATQNRLEHQLNFLATAEENEAAANSRIRDLDFAKEATNGVLARIRAQASTAVLGQANTSPQHVLSLLK